MTLGLYRDEPGSYVESTPYLWGKCTSALPISGRRGHSLSNALSSAVKGNPAQLPATDLYILMGINQVSIISSPNLQKTQPKHVQGFFRSLPHVARSEGERILFPSTKDRKWHSISYSLSLKKSRLFTMLHQPASWKEVALTQDHNKTPQTEWLQQHIFNKDFPVLEAVKSKIKVPADSVLGEWVPSWWPADGHPLTVSS